MAYRNIEGFEHGVGPTTTAVPGWNDTSGTAGGTPSVQTSNSRTGTYCLRCNQSGGACWTGWTLSQNDVSGSFYVYIPTLPGAARQLAFATSTTNSVQVSIYITANNKIGTKIGTDAIEEKAGQFIAGTWHRIDFKFVFNSTTYTLDLYFDGVAQAQDSSGGRSSTTSANFRLGSSASETLDRYYDDVVVCTAGHTFPHTQNPYHVAKMVPSSDGTHSASMPANTLEKNGGTDFTSSSTDAWDWMNAIPADDTTYVQAAATAATHYLEVNFANDADGRPILGACGFMCGASSGTASNDIECRMSDDSFSTFDTIWNGDWSEGTGAIIIKYLILSNAITPGASTVLNALQARWGFSGDASPLPRCSLLITQYVAEDPQPLTGALFTKAPTFNAGKVNMNLAGVEPASHATTFNAGVVAIGAQGLTGSLFSEEKTMFSGKVSHQLPGALFTKAPTFNAGTVTSTRALTGSLFSKAFTFNAGAITSTRNLSGSLFSSTTSFSAGAITTGAVNLSGALFTRAATFFAGSVAQALTGTLFQRAPTFNAGTVAAGAVTLTGQLFTKAPTFNSGAITSTRALTGQLFSSTTTFRAGSITTTRALTGALFSSSTTFSTGAITSVRNLAGQLFTRAPTFSAGSITTTRTLTGQLFTSTTTFYGQVIQSGTGLVGTLFQRAPTFNAGAIIQQQFLTGALFTKAPMFNSGTVAPGVRNLAGQLFTSAPSFKVGQIRGLNQLTGSLFVITPVFSAGAVSSVKHLIGFTLTRAPSFSAGSISTTYAISGELFELVPVFPQGLAANQGELISDQVLIEVPVFYAGHIQRFDYTPEWPAETGEEWPVSTAASWPASIGIEWPQPPGD